MLLLDLFKLMNDDQRVLVYHNGQIVYRGPAGLIPNQYLIEQAIKVTTDCMAIQITLYPAKSAVKI